MNRILQVLFVSAWMVPLSVVGQGTIWGISGGPALSTQKIGGFQRDAFIRYHVMGFLESKSEFSPNAIYGRLGYHVKGSAIRAIDYFNPDTGQEYRGEDNAMAFGNLSLGVGVKQRREVGSSFVSYGFGLRGDYNIARKFDPLFAGYANSRFIRKFTYGVDLDVGFERPLSELIGMFIEIGFSPDLAEQIFIPSQDTGYNYPNGQPVIIPEVSLTNIVFELRVGFRFWHKVIYTD